MYPADMLRKYLAGATGDKGRYLKKIRVQGFTGSMVYHLVPRLCLGTLYIEALPHKQEAESCNKSKVGVKAFKS